MWAKFLEQLRVPPVTGLLLNLALLFALLPASISGAAAASEKWGGFAGACKLPGTFGPNIITSLMFGVCAP
jgi:hypothetical protein